MNDQPKYNPNIHHRRSIRLQGYDYSQAGLYFITICTHTRECLFGNVVNDEMILNDAGKIADECWLEIPKHFPNAFLHEHIVMPNHVHGIIELTQTVGAQNIVTVQNVVPVQNVGDNVGVDNVGVQNFEPLPNNTGHDVGAQNFVPLREQQNERVENFQPQQNKFQKIIPRSIGSIIRGYKIGVTKWFHSNTDVEKNWQRNFHEHIIRDEQSYLNISEYIKNNPKKWKEDKFFK